jgi:hypothetical protein
VSRLQRFQDEANRLAVRTDSQDATVSVVVLGTGEIEVHLHPGALRGVTESTLAAKITRTIGDAMWDLRTEYRLISRQILGNH